jgi:hypothetical protein
MRRAVSALVMLFGAVAARADEPAATAVNQASWPKQVDVTVGEIHTRIDGPKLWTLSGIDFQKTMMATQESAYGLVLTIRNVGHLGTAHFLDVPGKPGQIEKENVTRLEFFVDGKPVTEFSPTTTLSGRSFRMERRSRMRTVELESTATIRDGVLSERMRLRGKGPLDLQSSYPFMYAWTHETTAAVFGNDEGIQKRVAFQKDAKYSNEVVKNATWVALFHEAAGKGVVCRYLKRPSDVESSLLLVDAPGVYHKITGYSLADKVLQDGFDATWQSAIGFFTATEKDWEDRAVRRAGELKEIAPER